MIKGIDKTIYDALSEGIIFVDGEGKIGLVNKAAKVLFGFMDTGTIDHPEGKLEKGDIVCIATNSMGADDGGLDNEALKKLGYKGEINKGNALVIAGRYEVEDEEPFCFHGCLSENTYDYSIDIGNRNIRVSIDNGEKHIDIGYGEYSVRMNFYYAISNMIVVNDRTGELKFAQSLGYTSRSESPKELLEGKTFKGKGKYYKSRNLEGIKVEEVFGFGKTIEELIKAASGSEVDYIKVFDRLNHMPVLCSIKPIDDGKMKGAVLIVENLTNIENAIKDKDYAMSKLNEIQNSIRSGKELEDKFPAVIGRSEKIRQIKKISERAAESNSNLLILGESGTGKSLLAREIHENSPRKDFAFISVNCSSIPENLLESELFGYEKGAFTGASRKGKKGMFELAHGGTIFLDEIGDMDIYLQAKLLKVIQEKSFYRLGGDREIKVDARIIAATNRSLEEAVREGKFRKDLYYRLNVLAISMPSLRDMKDDLGMLVENILPKVCHKAGTALKRISKSALARLKTYSFPGNIRELENILERAVNLTVEDLITEKSLLFQNGEEDESNVFRELKSYTREAEKRVLTEALIFYDYDLESVMKDLNIKKSSLYNKMKEYGIKNCPK